MAHEVVAVYGFDDAVLGWNVDSLFIELAFDGLRGPSVDSSIIAIFVIRWLGIALERTLSVRFGSLSLPLFSVSSGLCQLEGDNTELCCGLRLSFSEERVSSSDSSSSTRTRLRGAMVALERTVWSLISQAVGNTEC